MYSLTVTIIDLTSLSKLFTFREKKLLPLFENERTNEFWYVRSDLVKNILR